MDAPDRIKKESPFRSSLDEIEESPPKTGVILPDRAQSKRPARSARVILSRKGLHESELPIREESCYAQARVSDQSIPITSC